MKIEIEYLFRVDGEDLTLQEAKSVNKNVLVSASLTVDNKHSLEYIHRAVVHSEGLEENMRRLGCSLLSSALQVNS